MTNEVNFTQNDLDDSIHILKMQIASTLSLQMLCNPNNIKTDVQGLMNVVEWLECQKTILETKPNPEYPEGKVTLAEIFKFFSCTDDEENDAKIDDAFDGFRKIFTLAEKRSLSE